MTRRLLAALTALALFGCGEAAMDSPTEPTDEALNSNTAAENVPAPPLFDIAAAEASASAAMTASGSVTPIPAPTAAYTAATTKIDISGLSFGSSYNSITDATQTVGFSSSMQKLGPVPAGWATWSAPPFSETKHPHVLSSNWQNSMTWTLSAPASVFGFELEPNSFLQYTFTVDFYSGGSLVGSLTQPVVGRAGARLFAAHTQGAPFDRVDIGVVGNPFGFAVAQVRYCLPPTINLSVSPTELWPPNHKMVLVASGVSATSSCGGLTSFNVTVSSDEPVNGLGDGDTEPDWQVVDNSDGTFDVWLRAERSGTGDGRVYTITATATEAFGGATETATVTVAHDGGLNMHASEALAQMMDDANAELAAEGAEYRAVMAEYVTGDGDEAGATVISKDVGNKQLLFDFVPFDWRRTGWSGSSGGPTDDITYAVDLGDGAIDFLSAAATTAAIDAAMGTWDGEKCSDLPITKVSDGGFDLGVQAWLWGLGGSPYVVADIMHAGWNDVNFGGGVLGVTITFGFCNPCLPTPVWTDMDGNGKLDAAFREIYYDPVNNIGAPQPWPWTTDGTGIDVETVALHEAGHGLSQAHFGNIFFKNKGGIKRAPAAVMNPFIFGVDRVLYGTDNGGHCSNWAQWPNN